MVQAGRPRYGAPHMASGSPVVKRATRTPVLALAIAVVVLVTWLAAPLFSAPGDPFAGTAPSASPTGSLAPRPDPTGSPAPRPDQTAGASASASQPTATPSASAATSGSPGASPGPTPPGVAWLPPVRRYRARATPSLRAALDARLDVLRVKTGIPGISVSIVFADGSRWDGTSGMADVAARRPVTPDTVFPVASISKTFTAALILALAAEGRIGLDLPVTSYLPALPIDHAITVRQLLDHRSGLRDFFFGPGIDRALLSRPGLVWTADRSLRYVGKPFGKPGTAWHYSNTNYLLLGLLAQAVTGETVAAQLHDRFLSRLGLDHTSYQAVEPPRGPLTHAYRFTGANLRLPPIDLADGSKVAPFTSVVTAAGAAGSIASTAGDLATWSRALYDGDALDPLSRAAMVADALPTTSYLPTVAYGLGVQVAPINGYVTLGHSGRFLGAWGAVRWIADEHIAIAVLTNQSRSDPNRIVADLLRVALLPWSDCNNCPPGS
jgi:D-alanyl-D-alanine carboxypeptidase